MIDRTPTKIRLAEIDTPEKRQPFGKRAKQFTSKLAYGKIVTVKMVTKDRYGRTVAKVILPDGKVLNDELVRAGMAWVYLAYSKDPGLLDLEAKARENKVELWIDPNPTPPWVFRKKSKI